MNIEEMQEALREEIPGVILEKVDQATLQFGDVFSDTVPDLSCFMVKDTINGNQNIFVLTRFVGDELKNLETASGGAWNVFKDSAKIALGRSL